jgi:hypothetical protein
MVVPIHPRARPAEAGNESGDRGRVAAKGEYEQVNATASKWTSQPTMADAALGYAHRGFHIFPTSATKMPLTPHGHLDASTTSEQIAAWWRRWPSAGIGLACRPDLLVVDVDPRHEGDDSLRTLERQHAPLPDTWTSRTGGGGLHYLLRRPAGTVVDRPVAAGVDIKANGYVILPPSRHASGRRYEWLIGFSPDDLELAACRPQKRRRLPPGAHGLAHQGARCRNPGVPPRSTPDPRRRHDVP